MSVLNSTVLERAWLSTDGSRLILYVLPEVMASIDVDALSAVFQLEKAEVQYHIIPVPEFPIPNVVAILADEDFMQNNEDYSLEGWQRK